jgi:CheY-like chemotaxis protein
MNGQEAIDVVINDVKANGLTKSSYNLILMDCNMPFVDGYEATTKIRQYLYEMDLC